MYQLTAILAVILLFSVNTMALELSPTAFQHQVPSTLQALIPKVSTDKDIQSKLNQLSDKGMQVSTFFRDAIYNEGGNLLRLKSRIAQSYESGHCERSDQSTSCGSDFEEVHTALSVAMTKFNTVKSDVLSLQSIVESNIEPCRGRKEEHERSAAKTGADIDAIKGQMADFDQQIQVAENEATDSDAAAGQLDQRASDLKRRAKKKRKKGLWGAVAGIALAPFTGGASLAAGAVFAGVNTNDADDCSRKANSLRGTANEKRQHANNLRAKRDEAQRQKTSLEANMRDKQNEKVEFETAAQSLQEVTQFLHASIPVMEVVIRALQNVDVTIQEVKMETEAQQILLTALSNKAGSDVTTITSNKYVATLKQQWTELESQLIQLGASA